MVFEVLNEGVPLVPLLAVVVVLLAILVIGAVHQLIESEKELYQALLWK